MHAYDCWIGIDPGLQGAFAVIYEDNGSPRIIVKRFPIAGKKLDLNRLSHWFDKLLAGRKPIACFEKVGAMPDQGVVSTGVFMFNVGAVHGLLAGKDVPCVEASPTAWKGVILKGTPKDKQAAIDFCRAYYPKVNILASAKARVPDTNMADALCIARYCWVTHHDF